MGGQDGLFLLQSPLARNLQVGSVSAWVVTRLFCRREILGSIGTSQITTENRIHDSIFACRGCGGGNRCVAPTKKEMIYVLPIKPGSSPSSFLAFDLGASISRGPVRPSDKEGGGGGESTTIGLLVALWLSSPVCFGPRKDRYGCIRCCCCCCWHAPPKPV